ncbi:LexA family transcriptional regulator [Lysinibacillus fusiformis]|uniref:LexA family transcriptional regulator n=1 Tax=Lysinibacillus fusiformis TaxID=28031 RepID=UPI003CF163D5
MPKREITATEQRQIVARNLTSLLEKNNKKKIDVFKDLEKYGVSETTVYSWFNGKKYPRIDKIQLLADYFGVLKSDITEDKTISSGEGNNIYTFNSLREYPYIPTTVSAGLPINIDGLDDFDTVSIPDELLGKYAGDEEIFFMKVNGDSMNKIIPHKSLIGVKPVKIKELKSKDIVVYSECFDYSVKRFYQDGNKLIFRPESYDNLFTDKITTIENDELRIHGKVVTYIVNLD